MMKRFLILITAIFIIGCQHVNAAAKQRLNLVSVDGNIITCSFSVYGYYNDYGGVSWTGASIVGGPYSGVECKLVHENGTVLPISKVEKIDGKLTLTLPVVPYSGSYTLECGAKLVQLKYHSRDDDYMYGYDGVTIYTDALSLSNIHIDATEVGANPDLGAENYTQNERWVDVTLSIKESEASGWKVAPIKRIVNPDGLTLTDASGNTIELETVEIGEVKGNPTLRFKIGGEIAAGDYKLAVDAGALLVTDSNVPNPAFEMSLSLVSTEPEEPNEATLEVSSPESHAYTITCPAEYSSVVKFHPAEGTTISNVIFNGEDVTNECPDNFFVTPPLTGDNHLQIVTRESVPTEIGTATKTKETPSLMIVNSTVTIKGLNDNSVVEIFDSAGCLIEKSAKRKFVIDREGVYLLKAADVVFKFTI